MASRIYLDNSNFYMQIVELALNKKKDGDLFNAPSVRYERLLSLLECGEPASQARLYTSIGGGGEKKPWGIPEEQGWQIHLRGRAGNKIEKMVDVDLAIDMVFDALEGKDLAKDKIILVSGDSDFVPVIEKLQGRGIPVHVAFWGKHISSKLTKRADSIIDLTPHFDWLTETTPERGPNEGDFDRRKIIKKVANGMFKRDWDRIKLRQDKKRAQKERRL